MKLLQPGALSRIFYGWWIALALLVVALFSQGIGYYVIPVMLKPVTQEFGWSRAAVSGLASVFVLVNGVLAPLAGSLSDRYGPRRVMLAATPFFVAGLMLMSLAHSLWQLYASYALVSTAVVGLHTVPISTAIARWFRRQRGMALGIAFAGMSLGGLLIAPLTGSLVQGMGWRTALLILGGLAGLFLLPLLWGVVRSSPEEMGLAQDGGAAVPAAASHPDPPAKAADLQRVSGVLSSATFWLIGLSLFLISAAFVGVFTHLAVFLTDAGFTPVVAASALGVTSGIGILGKIGSGYLADRLSKVLIAVAFFSIQGMGLLWMMVAGGTGMVWPAILVFGTGVGAVSVIRPIVVGEFFSASAFGVTYGWLLLVASFGSAIGPPFAGWVYDHTGSYYPAFTVFLVAHLAAIFCLLMVGRLRSRR